MNKLLTIFVNIISRDTPESSKRAMGILGFVLFCIYIPIFKQDLIELLGYLSVALLGITLLEKLKRWEKKVVKKGLNVKVEYIVLP